MSLLLRLRKPFWWDWEPAWMLGSFFTCINLGEKNPHGFYLLKMGKRLGTVGLKKTTLSFSPPSQVGNVYAHIWGYTWVRRWCRGMISDWYSYTGRGSVDAVIFWQNCACFPPNGWFSTTGTKNSLAVIDAPIVSVLSVLCTGVLISKVLLL